MNSKTYYHAGVLVFCLGLGGTIALVVQYLIDDLDRGRFLWCSFPFLLLVSFFLFLRSYRLDPNAWKPGWQLGLDDLLMLVVGTGFMLSALNSLYPDYFGSVAVPLSMGNCFAWLFAMLRESRMKTPNMLRRNLVALGRAWTWLGLIGVGGLFVASLVDLLVYGVYFDWIKELIQSNYPWWPLTLHRIGLLFLPLGLGLSFATRRLKTRNQCA